MNKAEEIKDAAGFDRYYLNKMQFRANLVDANILIAKIARAGGKTEGVFGPRMIKVGFDMPGELSFLIQKTYVALFSNLIPNLRAYFAKPFGPKQKPILEEGIDYVIGTSKLPNWFVKPRYPISYPKHSIVLRSGHVYQLVASDQPDSIAGRSGVHAFIEEMKHNKGQKLKSRIFPGLRGAKGKIRQSPYYEGITGVSDTARVDLGEDNWFEEYEKNVDPELINDIVTVAMHINEHQVKVQKANDGMRELMDPALIRKKQKEISHHQKIVEHWLPTLREMRHVATYYITASTFVNKDFLGTKFFKTQLETLSMDEFLSSICNIAPKKVENMFFAGFSKKHIFEDSYIYESIMKFDLKDDFTLTANYLKYFRNDTPLVLGYDPGYFSSITIAQQNKRSQDLDVIKEAFCWGENQQGELARQIWAFFGAHMRKKKIILFYDRAGNKRREVQDQITTDAKLMKKELEAYDFQVEMKNERQRTIYYYEHYKLLTMIFSGQFKHVPKVRVCANECKNLVSSIFLTPVKKDDGKVIMDKSSERKIKPQYQAALSTQLSSSFMYLLFGLFEDLLPKEVKRLPNLPENITV